MCPLSLITDRFSERPGAVKGARFVRGGGKSFLVLKRFSGAHPLRRGPFRNIGQKGKGAGVSGGYPPWRGRGQRPRTLPRASFCARHKESARRRWPIRRPSFMRFSADETRRIAFAWPSAFPPRPPYRSWLALVDPGSRPSSPP